MGSERFVKALARCLILVAVLAMANPAPSAAQEPPKIENANLMEKNMLGCAAGYYLCANKDITPEMARTVLGYTSEGQARTDYRNIWTNGPPPEGDQRERALLACAAGENRCYDDGLIFTEAEMLAWLGFDTRADAKKKLDEFDAYLKNKDKKIEDGVVYVQDTPLYLDDFGDPVSRVQGDIDMSGRVELACLEIGCRGRAQRGQLISFTLGPPLSPPASDWDNLIFGSDNGFTRDPMLNGQTVPDYVGAGQRMLDVLHEGQFAPLVPHTYLLAGEKRMVLLTPGTVKFGHVFYIGFRKSSDKPKLLTDEDFELSGIQRATEQVYEHVQIPPEVNAPYRPKRPEVAVGGADRTECSRLERWIFEHPDAAAQYPAIADLLETVGYPDRLTKDEAVCRQTVAELDRLLSDTAGSQPLSGRLDGVWSWTAGQTPEKSFTVEMQIDSADDALSGMLQILAFDGGCPSNTSNDLCKIVNGGGKRKQYLWRFNLPAKAGGKDRYEGVSSLKDSDEGILREYRTVVIPSSNRKTLSLGLFSIRDGASNQGEGIYYLMTRKEGGLAPVSSPSAVADTKQAAPAESPETGKACDSMYALLGSLLASADTNEVQLIQAILTSAHVRYNPTPTDEQCLDAMERLKGSGFDPK